MVKLDFDTSSTVVKIACCPKGLTFAALTKADRLFIGKGTLHPVEVAKVCDLHISTGTLSVLTEDPYEYHVFSTESLPVGAPQAAFRPGERRPVYGTAPNLVRRFRAPARSTAPMPVGYSQQPPRSPVRPSYRTNVIALEHCTSRPARSNHHRRRGNRTESSLSTRTGDSGS